VHHAVAVEPVVAAGGIELRIGPVADVDAVEVVRDLALDLEVGERQLLARRRVRAFQIRVELGGAGELDRLEVQADRATSRARR
jgi:hypothetical protein